MDRMDTKLLLSESLMRLCEKNPLSKISVKQVYESCGVSKRTFYNHFQDKYDLVSWHWRNELRKMFEELGASYTYRDLMRDCYQSMTPGERNFSQIFRDSTVSDLFVSDCLRDSIAFFERFLAKHGITANAERLRFLLEYHFSANGAALRSWATGNIHSTPAELADWTIDAMPEELKAILKEAHAL